MSTAQEIVIDAYGMLGAIDITETAPSPVEMTKCLRVLDQIIAGWARDGLAVADQTRTCTLNGTTGLITNPIDPLTGLVDTIKLAPGMNASGTGISGRILTVNEAGHQIQMNQVTTIAGTAVPVAFTILPLEAKFERGVAALLALQIAPLIGEDNIPPMVVREAQNGWAALQANFMRIPLIGYDPALVLTSIQRTTSAIPS
jgi:hypothetical protein